VNKSLIQDAVDCLDRGGLVVLPTDTVTGLCASMTRPDAVERLYAVKDRERSKPLGLLVDSVDIARSMVSEWPDAAQRLTKAFWPGPLTIVLPRLREVPEPICAGGRTVGLRQPDHPVVLELLKAMGGAIVATSANRSGDEVLKSEEAIRSEFAGVEDLFVLGVAETESGGTSSTVVDLTRIEILREGLISRKQIEAVLK